MANFPSRCHHIKVNGTQCGSPALRRNRFCYFHKLYQDERIKLSADRARRGVATFVLPVLEDANSIQIALMQVIRLLVSQQMDHKTASLLLYALQTASVNLRLTKFDPNRHDVVLDPRTVGETQLNEKVWKDDDFEEEEDQDEDDALALEAAAAVNKEAARKKEESRKKQEKIKEDIARIERDREAELEAYRLQRGNIPPGDPRLYPRPTPENPTATVTAGTAELSSPPEKKPSSGTNLNPVREQVSEQIRKSFFPDGLPDSLRHGK